MKRILFVLAVIFTMCSLANAQSQTSIMKDSLRKVKTTVTKSRSVKAPTPNTAVTVMSVDSTDIDSTVLDISNNQANTGHFHNVDDDDSIFGAFGYSFGEAVLIPIIGIISVFGLPVFIIFLVFFFRYKNRKARYRLAEQALAAGQPLPEGLIKENRPTDQRSQGIKNIFLGIGLFIFLWAITEEFSIGTIGLLIMFIGIGQWLIGSQREKSSDNTVTTGRVAKPEDKNKENE